MIIITFIAVFKQLLGASHTQGQINENKQDDNCYCSHKSTTEPSKKQKGMKKGLHYNSVNIVVTFHYLAVMRPDW